LPLTFHLLRIIAICNSAAYAAVDSLCSGTHPVCDGFRSRPAISLTQVASDLLKLAREWRRK
jgi:hypothetical protein